MSERAAADYVAVTGIDELLDDLSKHRTTTLETIIKLRRRIKELEAQVLHENDLFLEMRERAENAETQLGISIMKAVAENE
jgi:cell division septum initiation protein DivIVA